MTNKSRKCRYFFTVLAWRVNDTDMCIRLISGFRLTNYLFSVKVINWLYSTSYSGMFLNFEFAVGIDRKHRCKVSLLFYALFFCECNWNIKFVLCKKYCSCCIFRVYTHWHNFWKHPELGGSHYTCLTNHFTYIQLWL